MPVRRKTFRIEEMMQDGAPDPAPPASAELAMCHQETLRELKALRAIVERHGARTPADGARPECKEVQLLKSELHKLYETVKETKEEIAALHSSALQGGKMVRVNSELGAVVGNAESATQNILAAAETIDANAGTLATELRNDHQLNLARDIQDNVVHIFEACAFHDLTGQRVAKITTALKVIEDHVARMVNIWGGPEALKEFILAAANGQAAASSLINGPRLGDETDHVTQGDIDNIFTTPWVS